jgi:hypothetical protein
VPPNGFKWRAQVTEGSSKAIEQLGQQGPEKLDVRIGAVYALGQDRQELGRAGLADHGGAHLSRYLACISSSCGPAVLVAQAAKPIPAARNGDHVRRLVGPVLREALVRPIPVIVLDEFRQHRLQVPPTEDPKVVECLAPCCPHPCSSE